MESREPKKNEVRLMLVDGESTVGKTVEIGTVQFDRRFEIYNVAELQLSYYVNNSQRSGCLRTEELIWRLKKACDELFYAHNLCLWILHFYLSGVALLRTKS